MTAPEAAAAQVAEHLAARPATLGTGRLVCIDGPSGSGKTVLAELLVERLTPASVVNTDRLCPGWDGLPAVPGILATLLSALAAGEPATYRAWDWHRDRPGDLVRVDPAPVLVVEGLGAGARALAAWTTTLVWLDADSAARQARALAREGEYFREHWESWAAAETAYFAAESVRERADLSFRTG